MQMEHLVYFTSYFYLPLFAISTIITGTVVVAAPNFSDKTPFRQKVSNSTLLLDGFTTM